MEKEKVKEIPIEVDKRLKKARNQVVKIMKNFKRTDLDWVVQTSISSTKPDKLNWCAQIESPANGLQPISWVCNSADELEKMLTLAAKTLDQVAVDKAYYQAQIEQCEAKKKFFEEKLEELENPDEAAYNGDITNQEV